MIVYIYFYFKKICIQNSRYIVMFIFIFLFLVLLSGDNVLKLKKRLFKEFCDLLWCIIFGYLSKNDFLNKKRAKRLPTLLCSFRISLYPLIANFMIIVSICKSTMPSDGHVIMYTIMIM